MTRFPIEVETRVRERAKNRCGYCLCPQHLIMGPLEIEHIYPESRGGGDEEDNLALACAVCNKHKSNKIEGVDPLTGEKSSLFNPNTQHWFDHFKWSEDGLIVIGLTAVGRATVEALHLDSNPYAILVRKTWVILGVHPPKE